jgi:hypothetical protein
MSLERLRAEVLRIWLGYPLPWGAVDFAIFSLIRDRKIVFGDTPPPLLRRP